MILGPYTNLTTLPPVLNEFANHALKNEANKEDRQKQAS